VTAAPKPLEVVEPTEPFDAVEPIRRGQQTEVVIFASGAQRFVFGQQRAVQARLEKLMPWIERVVYLRAGEDHRLREELLQVAKLMVVLADPSRLDPMHERWLKLRIAKEVKRVWRNERWFRMRVMSKEGEPGCEA
jgi:hypothetical protein